jgi:hypothetical protein
MPGFFSGDEVLFVAQNPGELKRSVVGDIEYWRAYVKKDYDKMDSYYINALKSSRGTYGTFINDIYGADWSDISFTNVIKCPFKQNKIPEFYELQYDVDILKEQVDILQPKGIVAVGSIADSALNYLQLEHLHFKHPSFLKRQGLYDSFNIQIYREQLKELVNS